MLLGLAEWEWTWYCKGETRQTGRVNGGGGPAYIALSMQHMYIRCTSDRQYKAHNYSMTRHLFENSSNPHFASSLNWNRHLTSLSSSVSLPPVFIHHPAFPRPEHPGKILKPIHVYPTVYKEKERERDIEGLLATPQFPEYQCSVWVCGNLTMS